jgi:peroxiredoxin
VKRPVAVLATLALCLVAFGVHGRAQAPPITPVTVGSPMPDFTLPAFQGGSVALSGLKGKTVILVFPRGYADQGAWCHVCNYQHSEPFPILMDADRAVTKGLGIFTTEWSGSKVDQNVPTVFVIDPAGIVQFKYFSQNTVDRPGIDHLVKVVEWVNRRLGT